MRFFSDTLKTLVKIVILVGNLLNHRQVLGLDILAQHSRGGVARNLHDIIDIHFGKVHQRSPGPSRSMSMYQVAFLLKEMLNFASATLIISS